MKRLALLLALTLAIPGIASADTIIDIAFPVQGPVTFSDDFNDPRSGGRIHHAIDIIAPKLSLILAPVDGQIVFAPMVEPSYGYMLSERGVDGYTYNFIHINNDTPGTDDDLGGPEHAYAPGIQEGVRVTRGEFIAWVGDSGDAEMVTPHLHFEIYQGDTPIDPYPSLVAAYSLIHYDPKQELALASSINVDRDIPVATGPVFCESNSLIRTKAVSTVYYCGQDGGRYVFQNEATFYSWYKDFSTVKFVTADEMAVIPLKGVVTFKPGSTLVKLQSIPKVYAISHHGTLRWVVSPEIATGLYGANWAKQVKDIPDGFFPAYKIGKDITTQ